MPPRVEDTLIAHHAFAGHLPKSLAHVASVYCDARPWKILAGKDAGGEKGLSPWEAAEKYEGYKKEEAIARLLAYNAADCQLTALSWQRMQADLESERAVYESDKIIAGMCQRMTEVGIASDEVKRRELAVALCNRKRSLLGRMRHVAGTSNFHPARLSDVRWVLFGKFKAPLLRPTKTGLAGTSNETLEYLKGRNPDSRAGVMADLILRWRDAAKTLGTYVEGGLQAGKDGRVHAPWKLGPVTGRLAGPLMTLPRYGKDIAQQVRGMYGAKKGYTLAYYDLSQAEARLAAYFSGDENLIAACEKDVHLENAKIIFSGIPEAAEKLDRGGEFSPFIGKNGKPRKWKEVARGDGGCKDYRDIAKNILFCVTYLGKAERAFITLRAGGFQVTMAACEEFVRRFRAKYRRYNAYVAENVEFCSRHGFLRTVFLGRIRWLGWHAKESELSNFPIQSGIADLQNDRLPRIEKRLPRGARLVAQVHDAAIMEVPIAAVERVRSLIQEVWDEPILVPHNELSFRMPVEIKVGDNWGEAFG